jgi:hypothetical protein
MSVLEPTAGEGKMASVIREYGCEVDEVDIVRHGIDYLTWDPPKRYDAIITNPPFKIAEAIIRKALKESDRVAMLLKSQFWHARKRLYLFNEYPPTCICPLTWRPDFMYGSRGGAPTMECIWTIWSPGRRVTEYIPLRRPS